MSVKRMGFVCYRESLIDSIDNLLSKLILKGNVNSYAYILHDCDVNGDGVVKKPHYHVYIEFVKQQNPDTICKLFSIATNLFITVNDKIGYLSYFVHKFDKDKYQYDCSLIRSYNLDYNEIVNLAETRNTSDDVVRMLFDLRLSGMTMQELLIMSLDSGVIDIYKRYYVILKECLLYGN